MQSSLNPYLNFQGQAREATEFYHGIFGGTVQINTYKEYQASQDPSEDDKIMHSMIEAEDGIILMLSDLPNSMPYQPGSNVNLSLSGDNEAELRGYWEKLSEGANIIMPLETASWGDTFGNLVDKFGISWMVNISPARA